MDNVVPFRPRDDAPPPPPVRSRRDMALDTLILAGEDGITWRELANRFSWHHGVASSVLSTLHRKGNIKRLAARRDRCHIYVHPDFVHDRPLSHYGSTARNRLFADMATFLDHRIPRCSHDDPRGRQCRSCEARLLHVRIMEQLSK